MARKGGKGKTLTLKKKWMMVMAIMSLCALCEIKLDGDQERKRPVGWMFLHCVLLCCFCSVSLGSPAANILVFAW